MPGAAIIPNLFCIGSCNMWTWSLTRLKVIRDLTKPTRKTCKLQKIAIDINLYANNSRLSSVNHFPKKLQLKKKKKSVANPTISVHYAAYSFCIQKLY